MVSSKFSFTNTALVIDRHSPEQQLVKRAKRCVRKGRLLEVGEKKKGVGKEKDLSI